MSRIEKFRIKQNDTAPALAVTLKDIDEFGVETVVNLNLATVVFNMRPRGGGAVKVSRGACTVTDADAGDVEYPWQVGDTDTAGDFEGEYEVTFADGTVGTYPRRNYVPISITDDIA